MRANIPKKIIHAFLDFPAASPAIDWLLQAWQVLSGSTTPPSRTAAVLLADDIAAWPEESCRRSEMSLWTRLSVIGAIWKVRCQRSTLSLRLQSFARCAIATAVSALVETIPQDTTRHAYARQWYLLSAQRVGGDGIPNTALTSSRPQSPSSAHWRERIQTPP